MRLLARLTFVDMYGSLFKFPVSAQVKVLSKNSEASSSFIIIKEELNVNARDSELVLNLTVRIKRSR